MSKRIPAKLKAKLGECLATWYRKFGKVAPRRAYHEDEEGGDEAPARPVFEGHPFLSEVPIGAPSDLSSIIVNDRRTLEEANKRSEELTLEMQNKLTLALGKKYRRRYTYRTKPQPF